MSLKVGRKGSAAEASFSELVLREKTASGKVGNLLLVFHFSRLARAVGMWESRSDFQGLGKTKGNLVLVFLVFHGTSFPRPSPVSSRAPLVVQERE